MYGSVALFVLKDNLLMIKDWICFFLKIIDLVWFVHSLHVEYLLFCVSANNEIE